ncbi:Phage related hypothetical protein [Sphingobium faniae]|nr:Phage related hypothetical protein [Sphingobium faniae]
MTRSAIMPKWMLDRLAGTVERPGEIELAPDEALSFSLFAALGTQWERHAMTGLRLGISYPAIPVTAQMLDIAMTPVVFQDIRIMERAALDEFARAAR